MDINICEIESWLELFLPKNDELIQLNNEYSFVLSIECINKIKIFMRKELYFIAKQTIEEIADNFSREDRNSKVKQLQSLLKEKGKDAFTDRLPLLKNYMEKWSYNYVNVIKMLLNDLRIVKKEISKQFLMVKRLKRYMK